MDELLTIGEFSQACGLSAKVLRTYAADGLLRPAAVDRGSGYRYYARDQVRQASTIARLRRAGTPLRDIARFLAEPTAELLDQWERDRDAEAAARRQALDDVRRTVAPAAEPATRLIAGTASEPGDRRPVNQDAVLLGDRLFAVADGLGERGELASVLAVEVLQASFAAHPSPDGLAAACRAAARAVWRRAQDAPEPTMGSTLTAVWINGGDDPALTVVSVGDSRAYLLRGRGPALRLTEDDSLVAGLVRAGRLGEEEARAHPQRFLLTRALGTGPDVPSGLSRVRHEPGDRLLLCTDGLSGELGDPEIGSVLAAGRPPGDAAAELVRLARGRGRGDDASAIVVDAAAGSAAV